MEIGQLVESRGLVTGEDGEAVDVQDDDEEVFNDEKDQHLVYHIKFHHDNEANYQEGSVLDEQSFHDAPDVCPEVQEARGGSIRGVLGSLTHHC